MKNCCHVRFAAGKQNTETMECQGMSNARTALQEPMACTRGVMRTGKKKSRDIGTAAHHIHLFGLMVAGMR